MLQSVFQIALIPTLNYVATWSKSNRSRKRNKRNRRNKPLKSVKPKQITKLPIKSGNILRNLFTKKHAVHTIFPSKSILKKCHPLIICGAFSLQLY